MAILNESGIEDEYAGSILEIHRSRSRGSSILPTDSRRKSSLSIRRKSSVASSILFGSRRRGDSSSGDSLLSLARSRSWSSAVSASVLEAVKVHEEVIEQAKYQLWPLDKKLRVVQQAKDYVKKHHSEMEERLAQSRTISSRLQQVQHYAMKFFQVS